MIRIGVITTWPPQISGLSEYSKYLYETLAKIASKLNIVVYAPKLGQSAQFPSCRLANLKVKYVWNSDSLLYPLQLVKYVLKDRVNVVHIQYEYWLYGRGLRSLLPLILLALLRLTQRKVVLTIHGTMPVPPDKSLLLRYHKIKLPYSILKFLMLIYVKLLCTLADVVIVHLNIIKKILLEQYRVDTPKVRVIRHGIPEVNEEELHGSKKRTFLVFGSIRPDKGIEVIVEAFARLRKSYNDIKLVIAGFYNPAVSPESKGYLNELVEIIRTAKVSNVELYVNVPSEKLDKLFKEAYVVILNYLDKNVLAASGPLALAIAYEKPIIATRIPRFLEYSNVALMVKPNGIDEITGAMEALLKDERLYQSLREKVLFLKRRDSWHVIAREHLRIYLELVRS